MKHTDTYRQWVDDNEEQIKFLEQQHKKEQKIMSSDEYIIEAYPEGQEIVIQKLKEYWEESEELYKKLRQTRDVVDHVQVDKFSRWFYFNAEKYKEGRRLQWLKEQIERLERLKIVYEKKEVEKHLSKEYFKTIKERERFDIDKMFARQNLLVDIASFYGILLHNAGSAIVKSLCPFHEEHTPSFFIYRNNWYHCFGCQIHGNFLDFIMNHKHITFREALEEANHFL